MPPLPLKGARLRLLEMPDDPDPIPVGMTGTVVSAVNLRGSIQIIVRWDNGRSLNLVCPPDRFEILEEQDA
jgi:hypothetical protein